jgi:hypothetical protein
MVRISHPLRVGRSCYRIHRDHQFRVWRLEALSFHSNFADQNQMIHFLKNVMMAGGLLQIAAFGAGAFSIDNQRKAGGIGSSLAASA